MTSKQNNPERHVGICRTAFSILIVVGLLFAPFVVFADSSDAQSVPNEGDTITLGTTSIPDLTKVYGNDAKGSYSYSDGTGKLVLYNGFAYKTSKHTGISCSVNLDISLIGNCSLDLNSSEAQNQFGIDVGDKDLAIYSSFNGKLTIKMRSGGHDAIDIHANNLTIKGRAIVSLYTEGGYPGTGINCSGSLKVIDSKLKIENTKAVNMHESIKCAGMEVIGSSVEVTAGSSMFQALGVNAENNSVKISNSYFVMSIGGSQYLNGIVAKNLEVSDSVFKVSVGKGEQSPFAVKIDNGGNVSIVHSTIFVKSDSASAFNVPFTVDTEQFDSIMASESDLEHIKDIKDPEKPTAISTNYKIVSTYVEFPQEVPEQSITAIAVVGVTSAVVISVLAFTIVLIPRGRP